MKWDRRGEQRGGFRHTRINTLMRASEMLIHEAGGSVTSHRPAGARRRKEENKEARHPTATIQTFYWNSSHLVTKHVEPLHRPQPQLAQACYAVHIWTPECVIYVYPLSVCCCLWDRVWWPRRPNSPWRDPYVGISTCPDVSLCLLHYSAPPYDEAIKRHTAAGYVHLCPHRNMWPLLYTRPHSFRYTDTIPRL